MTAGDYANWLQPMKNDTGVGVLRRPAYVLRVGKVRALIAIESLDLAQPKVMTRLVPLAQLEIRETRPPFSFTAMKAHY
jgi:hypothetical protein